jgi:hypothetical protein
MDTEMHVVRRTIRGIDNFARFKDEIMASPFKVWRSKGRPGITKDGPSKADASFQVGLGIASVVRRNNGHQITILTSSDVKVLLAIELSVETADADNDSITIECTTVSINKGHQTSSPRLALNGFGEINGLVVVPTELPVLLTIVASPWT